MNPAFHNTCIANTDLPYWREHGHLSHPDFVEPGLTGGVAEEVHLFAGVGDRVERRVAPRVQLSRQQLVRQLLLLAVALTEYSHCALLELPKPQSQRGSVTHSVKHTRLKQTVLTAAV